MIANQLSNEKGDSPAFSLTHLFRSIPSLLTKDRLFYLQIYDMLQQYRQHRMREEFEKAFPVFYEIIAKLVYDEGKRLEISKEDWQRLRQLYFGDLRQDFQTETASLDFECPFALNIWNALPTGFPQISTLSAVYTRGGGSDAIRYDNWNVLWIYLIRTANPIMYRLEAAIMAKIEEELTTIFQDPDNVY